MIAVVFNPSARGDRARAWRERLGLLAKDAALLATSGPGDAVTLARQAGEAGADLVVAAGGDGTVNEVVNGLCLVEAPRRPAMAVFPMGTVNVFARELGMSRDPAAAWGEVMSGRRCEVDIGVATHAGGTRRFVQLAGAGMDAEAIRRVRWRLKQWAGPLAYVWAGLGVASRTLPQIEVRVSGRTASGPLALVGNGRLYGGGFRVFPEAVLDDGLLDVSVLRHAHPLALARAVLAAWHGRAGSLPGVAHFQGRFVEMHSDHVGARFQVEGDDVGALPVEFRVEARALRVVVGRAGPDGRLGQRRD